MGASVACMLMLMDPNQIPGQSISPGQVPSSAPQQPLQNPPQSSGPFNPAQYDFITNPPKAPKKSLLPGSGSSKLQRIIIVVVILFVLLVGVAVVTTLLGSGGKNNVASLTKVLQAQTEISRVSTIASTKANGDDAQAIAGKVDIVLMTHKSQVSALATKQKIKIAPAQIAAGKNAQTDAALATAEKNGRFDEAFIQSMRTSMQDYQTFLKAAYNNTGSKSMRELLDRQYKESAQLLEDIIRVGT